MIRVPKSFDYALLFFFPAGIALAIATEAFHLSIEQITPIGVVISVITVVLMASGLVKKR